MSILLLIMGGYIAETGPYAHLSTQVKQKQVVGDKAMAPKHPPVVLPHALHIPGINKLAGKRVILASASPRRKEILQIFVRSWPVV